MADPSAKVTSSDGVIQTLKWVRKQNFKPVALRKQSKAAIGQQYVDLHYAPPGDEFWTTQDIGIGVVTGPQHSGPIDIDLDCPEAVFFAPRFLPPTAAVFGRASKRSSHYLFRVEADTVPKKALNDPTIKKDTTIIEIRGDGGHQTVFPGSLHEGTGEVIEWEGTPFPDVPKVELADLDRAVKRIAIATLITRHMWVEGQRNETCKHLTGMFYYLEWSEEEVRHIIESIMEYTGDTDRTRLKTVSNTYKKGEAGGKITGSNTLRDFLGETKIVDRILEWAGNETSTMLQEYNERFAVVSLGGKFRVADTQPVNKSDQPTFFSKDDFLNFMVTDTIETADGKKKPKAFVWLASPKRRSYRTVDFIPGVEDTPDVLNLWTGWGVEPKKASCQAWLDLLYYTIAGGDDDIYNWMINWFANIVREPLNKQLTSPVIVGRQGAGKSLLLEYYGKILGSCYVNITQEEHIHGRFNKHLASALLLHSEEALFGGDKKSSKIIKALITNNTRIFEQKGVDARDVKNYLRLAFTSNESWAAHAEEGDRRYTVIDLDSRKVDGEILKGALHEFHNDGPSGLFYYLMNDLDYKPELVRVNIKNDALLTLKQINFDPISSWWYETLKTGALLPDYLWWATKPERAEWPQVVSSQALYFAMVAKMKEMGQRYVPDVTMFSLKLNKMVGGKLEREQKYFTNPMSDEAPHDVRRMNAKQYTITNMPNIEICRRKFEEFVGQEVIWPKDAVKEERPLTDRY